MGHDKMAYACKGYPQMKKSSIQKNEAIHYHYIIVDCLCALDARIINIYQHFRNLEKTVLFTKSL
jgi:hypothetical protein